MCYKSSGLSLIIPFGGANTAFRPPFWYIMGTEEGMLPGGTSLEGNNVVEYTKGKSNVLTERDFCSAAFQVRC